MADHVQAGLIRVSNIVANASSEQPIPLNLIKDLPGVRPKLNSKLKFCTVKLCNGSVNLFQSGKIVFLGFKNIYDLDRALPELKNILGRFLIISAEVKPTVKNVVVRFDLGSKVTYDTIRREYTRGRLQSVARLEYEPELSNSIHIRFHDSAVMLVHQTGKGFITGLKTVDQAQEKLRYVKCQLNL